MSDEIGVDIHVAADEAQKRLEPFGYRAGGC